MKCIYYRHNYQLYNYDDYRYGNNIVIFIFPINIHKIKSFCESTMSKFIISPSEAMLRLKFRYFFAVINPDNIIGEIL